MCIYIVIWAIYSSLRGTPDSIPDNTCQNTGIQLPTNPGYPLVNPGYPLAKLGYPLVNPGYSLVNLGREPRLRQFLIPLVYSNTLGQ